MADLLPVWVWNKGNQKIASCALRHLHSWNRSPDMKSAFFSVLSPRKHIPAHRGLFKGIIRSHLGIIIPGQAGDCHMRIGDQEICWKDGKVVVFDDTYEHEVWNDTDQTRVVLLIDAVRPFKGHLAWLNRSIVTLIGNSFYVTEAMKNHQKWKAEFHVRLQGY